MLRSIVLLIVCVLLVLLEPVTALYAQEPPPTVEDVTVRAQKMKDFTRLIFRGRMENFNVRFIGATVRIQTGNPVSLTFDPAASGVTDTIISSATDTSQRVITLNLANKNFRVRKFESNSFVGIDLIPLTPDEIAKKAADEAKAAAKKAENEAKATQPKAKPQSILPAAAETKPVEKPTETKAPQVKKALKPEVEKPPVASEAKVPEVKVPEAKASGVKTPETKTPEVKATEVKAVERTVGKGSVFSVPFRERASAAVYTRGNITWAVFDKPMQLKPEWLSNQSTIDSVMQIPHRNYTIIRLNHARSITSPQVSAKKDDLTWSVEVRNGTPAKPSPIPVLTEIKSTISRVFLNIIQTAEPLDFVDPVIGDRLVIVPVGLTDMGVDPGRGFVDFTLLPTHQGIAIQPLTDETIIKVIRNGVQITSEKGLKLNPVRATENDASASVPSAVAPVSAAAAKALRQTRSLFPFAPQVSKKKEFTPQGEDEKPLKEEEKPEEKKKEESSEHGATKEEKKEGHGEKKEAEASPDGAPPRLVIPQVPPLLESRREMIDAINKTPRRDKAKYRTEYAKSLFREELYAEALGALDVSAGADPALGNDKYFMALLGGTQFMQRHFDEAAATLKPLENQFGISEGQDEIKLFRWAAQESLFPRNVTEEVPVDVNALYDGLMQAYPPDLRFDIALLAVDSYTEAGDYKAAKLLLDVMEEEAVIPKHYQNSMMFARAKLLEQQEKYKDAMYLYGKVTEDVMDFRNRARAGLALTLLKLQVGDITKAQAIGELEKLRNVWRGDYTEINLLGALGQFYVDEKKYLEGLRTWRELVSNYPTIQESLYTASVMKQTFISLFDKSGKFEVDPITALASFFEFRELTPVGVQGDQIVRNLVDYFIDADLLENAAAVLTHQVRFRSTGEEQGRLSIRLASIQLQNRRPDLALEVLNFMKTDQLFPKTLEQRKYLMAHTLLELDRPFEVFSLLAEDESDEAESIRLETFWKMGNWFGIMRLVEPELRKYRKLGRYLKAPEIRNITMLGMAYAIQQDRPKLKALRDMFLNEIQDKPKREFFDYITDDEGGVFHKDLTQTVQLETTSEFMTRQFYWPNKEWPSVINVLKPLAEKLRTKPVDEHTPEDHELIMKLGVAYLLRGDPVSLKDLTALQRDFAHVRITKDMLPSINQLVYKTDPIPEKDLEKPVPIRELAGFVESHRAVFTNKFAAEDPAKKPEPAKDGATPATTAEAPAAQPAPAQP